MIFSNIYKQLECFSGIFGATYDRANFPGLQILQIVSISLNQLSQNCMFYQAAAVSDFYVPWNSMVSLFLAWSQVLHTG